MVSLKGLLSRGSKGVGIELSPDRINIAQLSSKGGKKRLVKYATVPVINGLTDFDHPCQALCDIFTVYEKRGILKGLTMAYIGDGNNVLHSLIQACVKVGMNINYASPIGYKPLKWVVDEAL
ncbi:MAG: hypothetical protein NTY32_01390, partial [Bacteroidia bacterium]|nr:hypothetical protein [Bacteroidia bacterium]